MDEKPEAPDKKGNGREPQFAVIDRRPALADESAPAEPRYPTVVEQLKARAEEAERRAREISAAYRRIEEERDAFRERLARDLERRVELARAEIMRKVVEVLDDLDRAIAAARSARQPQSLASGVELIRERLFRALASEGVEVVQTVGRPFDPSLAEAVAAEATDDPARDSLVLEEMEKGYTLRGALLRPAKVRVARLARREPEEAGAGQSDPSPPTGPQA
jgi:molecular chaperone GrpE